MGLGRIWDEDSNPHPYPTPISSHGGVEKIVIFNQQGCELISLVICAQINVI